MHQRTLSALVAVAGITHAGCAHVTRNGTERFLLNRHSPAAARAAAAPSDTGATDGAPVLTLEEAIGKTRALMEKARPTPRQPVPTLEAQDPELKAALARITFDRSPAALVDLAAVYLRRGLTDRAYDYYSRATRMDSHYAPAYDGLARVWRDWGLAHLGLGDAYRAVYYAPKSAAVRNTLGTVLQALGLRREARAAYEKAVALDPNAAYAYNNLCYLSFLDGHARQAIAECNTAITLDAELTAAYNNLALTYAALGQPERARLEFERAGGVHAAAYNMGIVYMAKRQYQAAAEEFAHARSASSAPFDTNRRLRTALQRAAATRGQVTQ
jgi:tetratricopeptide (TPR) repeat protein